MRADAFFGRAAGGLLLYGPIPLERLSCEPA
jgi:hypothetical protein